ncbi:MAG: 50S ribosomal protein L9 [Patescibacteria group bacterium]
MKVIFLKNIRGVGQIGDIKEIADGYARNYLLPHGMAKAASANSVKEAENLKKKLSEQTKIEEAQAKEIADKLKDVVLELSEKANSSGKLFAAVGRKEIAEALKKSTGYEVAEDAIHIHEHAIKTVGEHEVEIKFTNEVSATIKVNITAKEGR